MCCLFGRARAKMALPFVVAVDLKLIGADASLVVDVPTFPCECGLSWTPCMRARRASSLKSHAKNRRGQPAAVTAMCPWTARAGCALSLSWNRLGALWYTERAVLTGTEAWGSHSFCPKSAFSVRIGRLDLCHPNRPYG